MSAVANSPSHSSADTVQAETLGLLRELIAFDTVSSRSNRALIDHVAGRLRTLGIATDVIPATDGQKASLWATIGPQIDGGVVLSGHSDVVPVAGQDWRHPPFEMTRQENRLYGRGSADMKGFIACALSAIERHRETPLRRPVHVALTYDEEIGCLGAPELLDWIERLPFRPRLALIGEPTEMAVVNAHKGIMVARTEIHGVEAHSSLAHEGVSAVGLAGQAITLLQRIQSELADEVRDPRFLPDHATLSVNRIEGGTAVNILAGHAWFEWDARVVPGISCEEVLRRFTARLQEEIIAPVRQQHPTVGATTHVIADVPALAPEPGGAAEALATRLLDNRPVLAVAFGAEAGQFQHAGLSTVIVGPGSMNQAHRADEFVTLEQLSQCETFLDRLVDALST